MCKPELTCSLQLCNCCVTPTGCSCIDNDLNNLKNNLGPLLINYLRVLIIPVNVTHDQQCQGSFMRNVLRVFDKHVTFHRYVAYMIILCSSKYFS